VRGKIRKPLNDQCNDLMHPLYEGALAVSAPSSCEYPRFLSLQIPRPQTMSWEKEIVGPFQNMTLKKKIKKKKKKTIKKYYPAKIPKLLAPI
jgi:hypothetical protein